MYVRNQLNISILMNNPDLKTEDLKRLHKTAIQAVYKTGEVLVNYDRSKLKVDEKEGASSRASGVVTEVDLLCQEIIVKELIP